MVSVGHILPLSAVTACRSCGSDKLFPVLDLGVTPLADRLVAPEELDKPDDLAALALIACSACSLAQLSVTVPPDLLFRHDYPYHSSVSPALNRHFHDSAQSLIADLHDPSQARIVEAASNDGYLLRHFQAAGYSVLGIDPATGPADQARMAGIETIDAYFTQALALRLQQERGISADLFLANNVLAHVPEINDFVAGIATILAPDGRAVIETPYLDDLIRHLAFDTIYHQHVFHYSMTALVALFARHGLNINTCERLGIHGGSLRLHISRNTDRHASVTDLLAAEAAAGIATPSYYAGFSNRIAGLIGQIQRVLADCREAGKRVAGYGAAAKAVTFMAAAGIGCDDLAYIVDRNPVKHGKYMPGTRVPIRPLQALAEDAPDYLLLLAWNFADEIMAQEAAYHQAGGRFIVPIPDFSII
ncbi:MAG TPA: methyltransferase [Rhodospirillaceae bacterium]|nr:methyltransferase [Rhodospirillaceae bacterium]